MSTRKALCGFYRVKNKTRATRRFCQIPVIPLGELYPTASATGAYFKITICSQPYFLPSLIDGIYIFLEQRTISKYTKHIKINKTLL
jgi:hypothetical protein